MLYHGLQTLGGGATLAGIVLGAITVFIIDRKFDKAALIGTFFTFFGFIHGEAVGFDRTPTITFAYLVVVASCLPAPNTRRSIHRGFR